MCVFAWLGKCVFWEVLTRTDGQELVDSRKVNWICFCHWCAAAGQGHRFGNSTSGALFYGIMVGVCSCGDAGVLL